MTEQDESAKDDLLAYLKSGQPLSDRHQTVRAVNGLTGRNRHQKESCNRPALCNVYGEGPMLVSDIPPSARLEGVVLGIDEAGRGSVVGPMVYGAAYWNRSKVSDIPKGFNDSKQLTEDTRFRLFDKLLENSEIGFVCRVLHASETSRNMLRKEPYNLNQMSHDAAMSMIRAVLKAGVNVEACFIDTVGNPEHYRNRLEREFPGIDFTVESKADANYAPCSAASVVAKVVRDRMIENWKFSEDKLEATSNFGSGYPSDPICKKWLEDNQSCPIFGFPDVVRFSWGPAKKALDSLAVKVVFEADLDEDDAAMAVGVKRQQDHMKCFLTQGKTQAGSQRPNFAFFKKRKIEPFLKL